MVQEAALIQVRAASMLLQGCQITLFQADKVSPCLPGYYNYRLTLTPLKRGLYQEYFSHSFNVDHGFPYK
jgi:hypothetical protein